MWHHTPTKADGQGLLGVCLPLKCKRLKDVSSGEGWIVSAPSQLAETEQVSVAEARLSVSIRHQH